MNKKSQLKMTIFVIKVHSVITKPYTLTIKFGIKGRGINSRTKAQQINDKKILHNYFSF